jgi:hypothetical protein
MSGLVDVDGTNITSEEMVRNALTMMLKDGETPSLYVGSGTEPVNEYTQMVEIMLHVYPHLFMYGCGAPYVLKSNRKRRGSVGLHCEVPSFKRHIQYLLSTPNRRFARDPSFSFYALNVIQRQEICRRAKCTVNGVGFQLDAEAISGVTAMDVEGVINRLNQGELFSTILQSTSTQPVGKLLKHIDVVGGSVTSGSKSKNVSRQEIYAYMHAFGPFHLFVTINPHDLNSPLVVKWATGYDPGIYSYNKNILPLTSSNVLLR